MLGVTPSRFAIIVYLLEHPEGATSTDLAKAVGLTRQAVNQQLQQLAQAGAVASNMDPYFAAQGQRPTYTANRAAVVAALHEFGQRAGISVLETADIEPDELRRKIASQLRSLLKLIDQADGKA
jgi:DNA-binding MarR family transcriptional regulator